jgi:hypothetical protein
MLRDSIVRMPAAAVVAAAMTLVLPGIEPAQAKEDCMKDCLTNCKLIAPKDTSGYCQENCIDYCEQPDRAGE